MCAVSMGRDEVILSVVDGWGAVRFLDVWLRLFSVFV